VDAAAAADDDDDDDAVDDDVVLGIQCYQLESVCRLRKYLSFVELGLSFMMSRVVFVSGWSELVKAQVRRYCSFSVCGLRLSACDIHCHIRHYFVMYQFIIISTVFVYSQLKTFYSTS